MRLLILNFRTFKGLKMRNYEQKNTNRLMVIVNNNHIQHAGWCGHKDNDGAVVS